VAEGIETEDQLALLRTLGYDVGQGFLFARPQSPADIEQTLVGGAAPAVQRQGERHPVRPRDLPGGRHDPVA